MKPASDASTLITVGIPGIAALVMLALVLLASRLNRGAAVRLGFVFALVASAELIVAKTGFLARTDFMPPPFLLMMLPLTMMTVFAARSTFGANLTASTPIWALVMLQGFRLPLELLMHRAAAEGIMPPQMTWTGWNFDVVTGASALVVAALAMAGRASRWIITLWNVMGLVLLAGVVAIAVSSMPAISAFGPAQTNEWVMHAPFVWLPGILVETALFLHLVIFRKLADAPSAAGGK